MNPQNKKNILHGLPKWTVLLMDPEWSLLIDLQSEPRGASWGPSSIFLDPKYISPQNNKCYVMESRPLIDLKWTYPQPHGPPSKSFQYTGPSSIFNVKAVEILSLVPVYNSPRDFPMDSYPLKFNNILKISASLKPFSQQQGSFVLSWLIVDQWRILNARRTGIHDPISKSLYMGPTLMISKFRYLSAVSTCGLIT